MGREHPSRGRYATGLAVVAAVGAVTLALLAVVGGGADVAAAQEGPVVTVENDSVDPGANATVNVTLTSAPQGISGYNVTIAVANPDAATITGVSAPGQFTISPTMIYRDGSVASVEAVDLNRNVEPGATDVFLGSITVRGETDGETAIRVRVQAMDADGGGDVDPAIRNGTLTVGEGTPTPTGTPAATLTPTDSPTPTDSSSGGIPGFGAVAAAVALAGLVLFARRQS